MRAFHDEVLLKRYRPRAEEEVRRCKQEGLLTILVSATFIGIARPAAEHLGVDAVLATEMEKTPEGTFTGRVLGEVIAGPRQAERRCRLGGRPHWPRQVVYCARVRRPPHGPVPTWRRP